MQEQDSELASVQDVLRNQQNGYAKTGLQISLCFKTKELETRHETLCCRSEIILRYRYFYSYDYTSYSQ